MRFDDRLKTVLSLAGDTAHDRAVRWRQLVDLVARAGEGADRALIEEAIGVVRSDRREVGEPQRAAAARAIAGLNPPLELVAIFASDTLTVAAPLLAGNGFGKNDLKQLRAAASIEVARFLDTVAPKAPPVGPEALPEPSPESVAPVPSVSEVLARIERLREERARRAANAALPKRQASKPAESTALFRWECDPSGEIDWVEGAPRGPLVGRSIAAADPDEGVDECVERAFAVRSPFRDCLLELAIDGELAGPWSLTGAPAFAAGDGRFIGYRGIARRGAPSGGPPVPVEPAPAGHDALREMIHEIKTPLNAIIGFAEIIDGQYFGPAHRRYRERAAEIVVNARSLLQAAEDLDFVARMQSQPADGGAGTDLEPMLERLVGPFSTQAAKVGARFVLEAGDLGSSPLAPDLAERLVGRFVGALIGVAGQDERLVLVAKRGEGKCALSLTRPAAIRLATRDDLLDPDFTVAGADHALLGLGFSLRLVEGLAELAGGGLDVGEEHVTLLLPVVSQ